MVGYILATQLLPITMFRVILYVSLSQLSVNFIINSLLCKVDVSLTVIFCLIIYFLLRIILFFIILIVIFQLKMILAPAPRQAVPPPPTATATAIITATTVTVPTAPPAMVIVMGIPTAVAAAGGM